MPAGSEPAIPGRRRLGRSFFARPTLEVARDLLGRRLVHLSRGHRLSGCIVEVEAYIGPEDTACHGRSGVTRRNEVLFGPPGRAYVYFTYGMHHLLNLVTEREGFPSAVLLRALEPEEGIRAMTRRRGSGSQHRSGNWLAGGPARLCRALGVDLSFNGDDLLRGRRLFVEEGEPFADARVARGPRVGIGYADEEDREREWRFYDRTSRHVSPGGARTRRRSASPAC